jgi:D-alanyl-D-alanine carboxypeptidase (penicillin-binding protein 5/6)
MKTPTVDLVWLCSLMLVVFTCCHSELSANDAELVSRMQRAIEPLTSAHKGEVSISVQVLDAHGVVTTRWGLNSERVMPTASLIKLPIMIEAYRQAKAGMVSLDDQLEMIKEDQVPGSGILTSHFSAGLRLSLRDAIRLMIRYSDNTATNLVLDRIGIPTTGKTMAEWGFPETQIHSKVFKRDTSIAPERSERFGLGSTTAADMTELLVRLERGEVISNDASREMIEHLLTCDDTAKLPRELPKECRVAHKTGSVNRSRTAAGLISGPKAKFAICVLTDENEDTSWSDENAADKLISRIARVVYDEVSSSQQLSANSEPTNVDVATELDRTLRVGANGELVEALQRTLNAQINAGLSVDGDFGPATEQAVRNFQQTKQLDTNGVVDAPTWRALGTLVEQDAPVESPEVINNRQLSRAAPLDPWGAPEVSAKGWAVLDVEAGVLLGQGNGHERLPMASTTKVMTALLVLELAQTHPQLLDEVVTFSQLADATIGSAAGVRAGEQLPVRDLLYGLLLPSGNDAAVALAEHFGARVDVASDQDESGKELPISQSASERFVAAMNRRAAELGLSNTHFANPHGLTAEAHYSSASDLAKLASVALRLPLMREVISSRQRGAMLNSSVGYSRNVLWENTNRLLAQAGFVGMKTGTTDAAGACLIAVGGGDSKPEAESSQRLELQGNNNTAKGSRRETIVVVLGSSSSDARYIDARNLFAWAWRQSR